MRDQHDWALVLLAAVVCIAASFTALTLARRARATEGRERLRWIGMAGLAAGFGIWATHFIAMLAYNAGVATGYDLPKTFLSLIIAVTLTGSGIALAVSENKALWRGVGGALLGLGVAGMHYTGMSAVIAPAQLHWHSDMVAASVLIGMALGAAALWLATGSSRHGLWGGSLLMVLGIVAHHFTGMGALDVTPDPRIATGGLMLNPGSMSITVAVVAVTAMGFCIMSLLQRQQFEAAVAANERHMRILIDSVRDYAIYMLDPQGRVTNWNAGAQRFKGYEASEIVGQSFEVFFPEADRQANRPQQILQTALEQGRYEEEGQRVRKDGTPFLAHVVLTPMYESDGSLIGFAKVTRDITQRRADREKLVRTTHNFDTALRHMSQGLSLYDSEHRLVFANPRVLTMFGNDAEMTMPGTSFRDILTNILRRNGATEAHIEARYRAHMDLIAQPEGGTLISEFANGTVLSITHRPMPEGGWVSTIDDVTARRQDEARIAHMARHDGLTGLPNREHFNQHADRELERALRAGHKVAAVAIDLDRFKEINDMRGHAAGDQVLKIIAERLQMLCDDSEFVARIGGDEFACVKHYTDPRELSDFVSRVHDALHQRIDLDGFELATGGSVGVATYPNDADGREPLMNNADLALYRAKSQPRIAGQETVCYYEARMDEAARDRRALAKDLWQAIARDELRVHYQVQKSVTSQAITGYEALLRWQHPQRGFVSPVDFIPVAEECGAILEIGEWVLRTACAEAASWNNDAKVAVNLSPVQLSHPDLVGMVHAILIETGLSPQRLELEITESTIIGDKTRALHILRQIKSFGVTIAIDDFGTGYSSLDTLNAFPFDKIKIDRSFLMEAEQSPQARAIIRAILALGKSLEVPVLAEGVETIAQLELLRSEGCDEAQGYYFGRPAAQILDESSSARLSA
ncbi:EAL domain-containing protein [Asticcacaulis sp. AND118]|uniref:bifunctional diguanylate cyclase/phosphodiesterase n=1 Tax=Asticcacaulis sp. AND118 TaxID=2840468 RepID=UPI001CFFD17F|nr:EAL domain-containing protein [Asticcacaulis sp. AND118]UDF04915.1 EAL domain-containing protein [Asticcacaulis sp. AND118]